MSILIVENDKFFTESLGFTDSISTTTRSDCTNVTKTELYAKLGVAYRDTLPDITILSGFSYEYSINFIKSDISSVVKLNPDLVIVNAITVNPTENSRRFYENLFKRVISMYTHIDYKGNIRVKSDYHINKLSGKQTSCGICDFNLGPKIDAEMIIESATDAKNISIVMTNRILIKLIKQKERKIISSTINDSQRKIMNLFNLPDQSTIIATLNNRVQELESKLDEYKKLESNLAAIGVMLKAT